MRSIVIGVAWIAASGIAMQVSAQVADWESYKPHALKAWKTYREQFECVGISGEDSSFGMKFELYFDKNSGNAIYRQGSPRDGA